MSALIETLKAIVGPGAWVTDADELEPHLTEWRGAVRGRTPIMVMPGSTEQVAKVVKVCHTAGVAIVPQGGNTGMCAGAVPDASGTQVILNLSRMDRVLSVNPYDFSIVAQAGCILANMQSAAREVDRYLPLSHGGEGSCQVGGNLSTNAGGINVIRYGTTRDLVLGVEVVLPDGTTWDGIRRLRKNTAGYDLKHLFIGSEGTLGIITAVAMKLFPDPGNVETALAAVESADNAIALLAEARAQLSDRVQAFELIGKRAFELVQSHIPGAALPFDEAWPWYVLIDASVERDDAALTSLLDSAMQRGDVSDAVVAKNAAEAEHFWRMRHSISEAEKHDGIGLKHDISVPIDQVHRFLEEGERRLAEQFPETALVVFGHVGDGNLHYNVVLPADTSAARLDELRRDVSRVVYTLVTELGGSISAEHGIGVLKRDWLAEFADPVELQLMRALKTTFDPKRLLNPGKIF